MVTRDALVSTNGTPEGSAPASPSFDIGAYDFVRRFVEHLMVKNAPGTGGNGCASDAVDLESVATSVADARSLEHAIGRIVVIADRLTRGVVEEPQVGVARTDSHDGDIPTPPPAEDPFFAFSMVDVVPDFGDSRYRTRFARRVARIAGRRAVVTAAGHRCD